MIDTSEHTGAVLAVSFTLSDEDKDVPCLHCQRKNFDHADHCPFRTGLWPICDEENESSVHSFYCPNCEEEHTAQYACPRCERFFEDDDYHRFINDRTGLLAAFVEAPDNGLAICLDCAEQQAAALRELLDSQ